MPRTSKWVRVFSPSHASRISRRRSADASTVPLAAGGGAGDRPAGRFPAARGGQGELLEAEQWVARGAEHPAQVPERVADDVWVANGLDRLEDEVSGGEPQGELLGGC